MPYWNILMVKCSSIFLEKKKEVSNKDDRCNEKDEWKQNPFSLGRNKENWLYQPYYHLLSAMLSLGMDRFASFILYIAMN